MRTNERRATAAYGVVSMSAREVLAANLKALMTARPSLGTVQAVEKATEDRGLKVGKSTVARALKSETTLNLDYIEVLAAVFDVDPWQLLVQGMNPKNPPVLRSTGRVEEDLYKKIEALTAQFAEQLHEIKAANDSTSHANDGPG